MENAHRVKVPLHLEGDPLRARLNRKQTAMDFLAALAPLSFDHVDFARGVTVRFRAKNGTVWPPKLEGTTDTPERVYDEVHAQCGCPRLWAGGLDAEGCHAHVEGHAFKGCCKLHQLKSFSMHIEDLAHSFGVSFTNSRVHNLMGHNTEADLQMKGDLMMCEVMALLDSVEIEVPLRPLGQA